MIGRINRIRTAFYVSVIVLAGLIAVLAWPNKRAFSKKPLMLYCAAGLQEPVLAATAEYKKLYGVEIQVSFAGSETVLQQAETAKVGDLYLPADERCLDEARERKLIDEVLPLATMRPVLVVQKGNPRKIKGLDDVLNGDITISQANPDAAAIGKVTRAVLQRTGQWDALQKHRKVDKETVNAAAVAVAAKSVDAAIVWDATAFQMSDRLTAIELPEFTKIRSSVSVAILKSSERPTDALRFARFLAARDKGLVYFKRDGFAPVDGDKWEDEPQVHLYAGAMLRAAIDPTIDEFERREGVQAIRHYNGCGILISEMQADPFRPDAYFACDVSFMDSVNRLFADPQVISSNQVVILVARQNPKQIKSLADLGRPRMRVGLAREQQSALGDLTRDLLKRAGCYDEVRKNVVVENATGDGLVNQFVEDSLDAVVVYRSNAEGARDRLDIVHLSSSAKATQPLAIAKQSEHKHLMGRLCDALKSPASKKRFEDLGFIWVFKAE